MTAFPQAWDATKTFQITAEFTATVAAGTTWTESNIWVFNDKGSLLGGTAMTGWYLIAEASFDGGTTWERSGPRILNQRWIEISITGNVDNTGGAIAAQTVGFTAIGTGQALLLTSIPQGCGRELAIRVVVPLGASEAAVKWRLVVDTVSPVISASDLSNGVSGTGAVVLATGSMIALKAGTSTSNYTPTGVLTRTTALTQTTAVTTEETLWTYSLPANVLAVDGQALRITLRGTVAANGNAKTIRIKFGASSVTLNPVTTTPNGVVWRAEAVIVRISGTSQYLFTSAMFGATAQPEGAIAPAATLSGAVTISITGQNGVASAADITLYRAIVEYV